MTYVLYGNCSYKTWIILGMGSAKERRHYHVMPSLVGWAHTQTDPYKSTLDLSQVTAWRQELLGVRSIFICINISCVEASALHYAAQHFSGDYSAMSLLMSIQESLSALRLPMPWCRREGQPSAAVMLTWLWTSYDAKGILCHCHQHIEV